MDWILLSNFKFDQSVRCFEKCPTTHWQCKLHILGEKILDTTHWQPKLHIFMVLTTHRWAEGLAPLHTKLDDSKNKIYIWRIKSTLHVQMNLQKK